jgi:hypothetical protein
VVGELATAEVLTGLREAIDAGDELFNHVAEIRS